MRRSSVVEQRSVKPFVGGSTPPDADFPCCIFLYMLSFAHKNNEE